MKQIKKKLKESNPFRNRKYIAIVLYIFCFILFFSIFSRFAWIMVKGEVNGENLVSNVHNLYTRNNILQANRGTIYDSAGNPIAMDSNTYKMIAVLTNEWSTSENPIHIQEPEAVAQILTKHLSMSEKELVERLTQENSQVEFGSAGKNLTYETVSAIEEELEEEELTGITFEEKKSRLYPNGIFASHTIGLAQSDMENQEDQTLHGVLGLEKEFDDSLSGKDGWIEYQRDRFGYVIPDQEIKEVEPTNGKDIQLTLDRRMQIYLESIVEEVNEQHEPEVLTATLMHAKTGEILATTQRPTFNGTTKEGIDQTWQNYLTEYTFDPGSTLKAMTLASAVEEGVFNPNDYYKSGKIQVGGGTVHDVKPEGWGTISYLEGVARSSNVAFVHQVQKMGLDTWKEHLDSYGFGQPTGISLPNEYAGSNPYSSVLQQVNTSFGQGISVTPVQMLQAFSALTNKGKMVQPHLVKAISNGENEQKESFDSAEIPTLLSEKAADQTLDYLTETVNSEVGTARGYAIDGFEIAAKTGTAQIVGEDGSYLTGNSNYVYSVVGMGPVEDPELIFYVTVQKPKLNGVGHGSHVVQKIFNPVMKRALEYYSSEDLKSEFELTYENMDNLIQKNTQEVINDEKMNGKNVSIIGTGDKIVQQYPLANSEINNSDRIILMTNGAMTLPDLTGWSRGDVIKLSELTGVDVSFSGEGFVESQNVSPNSFIESETKITVTLSANE
ncbi:MAG: penicillin-binding transpeptidase domain-containing protein [Alkalibacterium gilvum]|uniref:Penicillin-binding protein 2B n=1 Tax=Alkalibacterium gilvum TaxID=1130080 RepID=A0A1H6U2Z2_9LACT|nr:MULTISPECIES: penicillin-binding transpeptidase domain-containing protein [Alkalibacterium]MDN6293128.1 PASTA domain-containing protein [Alkalibacterium sp.]MDN6295059.1 PASTA domain-containing protein [Alkalibacterium sp.]MDN6729222.1 PASTA domain-containing protein [Alkalibacterium sp.]SEI82332.1 penicillin-binding protein 2B [Alkalibacterium gilvum]HAJ69769.1 PASTA domain-containing protein [Alkalibacterium sp.]